ncbi:MAG: hypothetical protein LC792_10410, partial [Actinobacteria bacterium]|nr:hypothetical protein [Actinomycetota bacterium]
LRAQFGIGEQDNAATARTKVAGAFQEVKAAVEDVLPILWDFLGINDPEQPTAVIDPEARQRQIFVALNRLRRARGARAPVVILVEDLHWLDPGSEAFLENLVNSVPGTGQLVVTTFRPEYRVPWFHRSHYGQLPLQPLGEEASDELARNLLGSHPSLDGMAQLVRARTGGNPFFIEEVVQGLFDDGTLHGRRGAYQLATTISEVRIPATVQAVLTARMDRLSERDKTLLQTAAVIGRQFSRQVVGRVSDLAEDQLEAALRTLVEAEFVYETAGGVEEEYTFKHALTEEVAYSSQLTRRRTRIHAAVARTLAEVDVDTVDARASLIAQHYERGEELLEATRWNARAAGWAGFSHPVEAARHWRRVRVLVERLGPSPEAADLGLTARLMLLSFHWRLGAASEEGQVPFEDEAATMFAEAEAFARDTRQPKVEAMVLMLYGNVRQRGDAVEEGYTLNLRAADLADETADPALRASARVPLAWCLFVLGRIREAAAMAEEVVSIIGEDRSLGRGVTITSPYAWCRMQVAHFSAYVDRLDDGLVALERVIDLAAEEGDLETQAWARRHCAVFADLAGADPDVAAAHALQGLQWAEEAGGAWSRVFVREGVAIS